MEIENVRVPLTRLRTSRPTRPQTSFMLSMGSVPLIFRNFLVGSNGKTKVVRRWAETHHLSPNWPKGSPLVTDDVLMALELGYELGDPVIKRAISDEAVNPLLCLDYQSNLTQGYNAAPTTLFLKPHGYAISHLRVDRSPFSSLPSRGLLVKVVHLDRFHVYVRDYNMTVEPMIPGSFSSGTQKLDMISRIDTARMWGEPVTSTETEDDLHDTVADIKNLYEAESEELPF